MSDETLGQFADRVIKFLTPIAAEVLGQSVDDEILVEGFMEGREPKDVAIAMNRRVAGHLGAN